jgi:hypothetical protein
MDPDFLREIIVLLGMLALYVVGSMMMLKGHKTDLSAVTNDTHGGGGEGPGLSPRLNRRRKAIARENAQREIDRGDRHSTDVSE